MKRSTAWWGAGAAFTILLIGASLPMRLALDAAGAAETGVSARSVSGSIWSATLHDARLGTLPLGRITARLSPLALFSGRTEWAFARDGGHAGPLSGRLLGGSNRGAADVNGDVLLGLRIGHIATGRLQLAGVSMRFDHQGRCTQGSGNLRLALSAPLAGLPLAQGLGGPLSCRNGRLQATLTSQSGMETLRLHLDHKGGWKARLLVAQADDPMMIQGLMALGFQSAADGYALAASGQI
ncbi:MAG TPA: type II secretion system protein N [Sphingopyxis sp.]|nr:type II secretion system protein N [Sphingopyxis sp.]